MKKLIEILVPFHFDDLVGGESMENGIKTCWSSLAVIIILYRIIEDMERACIPDIEVTVPLLASVSLLSVIGNIALYCFLMGGIWIALEVLRKVLAREENDRVLRQEEEMDHPEERCMFSNIFSHKIKEETFIVFLKNNQNFLKTGTGLALLYMLLRDRKLINSNCSMMKFHSYVSQKIFCVKYCQFSQKVTDSNINNDVCNTSEAKEYQCLQNQLDKILISTPNIWLNI